MLGIGNIYVSGSSCRLRIPCNKTTRNKKNYWNF